MKTSFVSAFAALAAALTLSLQARASGPQGDRRGSSDAKTVVLVHGAFTDGSGWNEVIRILQRRGLNVVSVQNPLTSLAADSAAVHRAINQQQGLVVLAGHSWGGAVITEAGLNPKVSSLVYVAAFAPDGGESINDLLRGLPPPPWAAERARTKAAT
jgi:pimeloyl-ACP methyl ester carboxylesterase